MQGIVKRLITHEPGGAIGEKYVAVPERELNARQKAVLELILANYGFVVDLGSQITFEEWANLIERSCDRSNPHNDFVIRFLRDKEVYVGTRVPMPAGS